MNHTERLEAENADLRNEVASLRLTLRTIAAEVAAVEPSHGATLTLPEALEVLRTELATEVTQ